MHQNGEIEYGSRKAFVVHMNILEYVNYQWTQWKQLSSMWSEQAVCQFIVGGGAGSKS